MDRIVVVGGARLEGEIAASGSKNASLALMAAALLARGESELRNVPRLRDVEAMLELLRALGARADWHDDHTLRIDRPAAALARASAISPGHSRGRSTSRISELLFTRLPSSSIVRTASGSENVAASATARTAMNGIPV